MTFCNYLREEPAFLPYREGYKKGKRIKFFDVLDRYSISYGKGKGTNFPLSPNTSSGFVVLIFLKK